MAKVPATSRQQPRKDEPKVSVKKGSCELFFSGMPNFVMTCPLCGTRVSDGQQHRCKDGKPVIEGNPLENREYRKALNKVCENK
jgi:hypothetical protein